MAHIFLGFIFTLQNHLGRSFFDEYSFQMGLVQPPFWEVWKVSFGLKKGNILAVETMILAS